MTPTKYTVAGDFHGNAHALETILKQYNNTQIVLLGDFFDSNNPYQLLVTKVTSFLVQIFMNEADGITPHRNFTNKSIVSSHTPQQFFDKNETTYTHDIVTLHNINDPKSINRYVIDGGSNSGAPNQHVNIVQFDMQGNLLDIAIMH